MESKFRTQWIFHLGDYRELQKKRVYDITSFDFVFIDALHTEEFARGYVRSLLRPLEDSSSRKQVVIHDIVADPLGGGRESSEIYKYLAFSSKVKNVFTMSAFTMPRLHDAVDNAVQQLNMIRAKHKIVEPCLDTPRNCSSKMHDYLYFENGDAPSIFFTLDPRS
mmetsp:Transcript_23266/g.37122  ORF Transcript_23266/g.37122 Transcript_23266/m.37122 type:complete len:165 (+) Transcript_23266:1-495(+)